MEQNIVELDVRPILLAKQEPFQVIMETVEKLKPTDVFVMHATFNPTPLLNVMKSKGYANSVECKAEDHYVITFTREG
ncbi:DUF2249 domain-containing protein [Ammoniphilus resinae]|uniref:Uncharacterized protein (DUF2249 family) n=1 Tax=Ammoniphilus resinae TaxID=861532 RepID=A0ABS4GR07_9BACL|nr:DUF2249 domain-containing protein [Ammoniphilus resinae]MBP1932705.1 uncharacterized protein (DUF2249 family) [Ammoniphilus resinae]